MLFTLDRFSSVELRAGSLHDWERANLVLSPKILAAVNNSRRNRLMENTTLAYVEIPMNDIVSGELEIESFNQNKHIAVHVTGWENFTLLHKNTFTVPNIFGITVQNCIEEINLNMTRLKKIPFINKIDYLVCNVKPAVPIDLDLQRMQKYLGTLFYTKAYIEKIMSKHIRSKTTAHFEVMFRINLNSESTLCPNTRDEQDRFLKFLNETNQHSKAYGIRYFLVDAFQEEVNSGKCSNTWWRIKDYSDFKVQSVYVDREYEYLGLETKLSIQLPDENFSDANDPQAVESKQAYFIFAPIVFFSMVLILILWVKLRQSNQRFLTEQEINQFRNGCNISNNDAMDMSSLDAANTMYMKFSDTFEIPEWKIDLQGILGCGQFGMVHKGILLNRGEVAIKVPRADCGKEQFLSTLAELKILCHIGSHDNIVSFLGASTKKISSGKLLIVIEYCEKGCLQSHLRKLQQPDADSAECLPIDLPQLYSFSHQIACGMEYIAEQVVHGDLATRNVLLTSEYICKIADFGLSRRLYANEYVKTSKDPLPWRWMAPESLKNLEFTVKSDVWSYRVMLWEIYSLGAVPYPGKTWTDEFLWEMENGYRMAKAEHATEAIHDIMMNCWKINKAERLSFTELKTHFSEIRSDEYRVINEC